MLKLEKEILSKNEQIRSLGKDVRKSNEECSGHQNRVKEVSREKNQRIELLKEEFKVQLEAAKRHQREKEEVEERCLRLKRDLSLVRHEKKLAEDLSANEQERLRRRLKEVGEQLEQANKECARLRGKDAHKDGEVKRLRREVEEKDERIRELTKGLASGPRAQTEASVPSGLDPHSKLGFELYEREQRRKHDAMQQSLYRLQEKLDARVATSRKYKEAGRALQRKVAAMEAELRQRQEAADGLERRINALDGEVEVTCTRLGEAKAEAERTRRELEAEAAAREEASREASAAIAAANTFQAKVSELLAREGELESRAAETELSCRARLEEAAAMEYKATALSRRLASADEHIEKMAGLLRERDLDAERGRSRFQEQQAMIERQEHELNGMRLQYEGQMKRMQQQRQELDRLKGSRPFGSRRPSLVSDHGMESEPARDPAHRHDDQVAFLRAELSRSMQREKSLILNIHDRDQKIESAERYLGNMESVVKKLSKYT